VSVVITEDCIRCGACEWECPNEAISPGDARPVVDEKLCTECHGFFGESQCAVVCPAGAIKVLRPEPVEELLRKFHRIHPNLAAQDTWIWERIGL
jgi:ferredoxin